MKKENEEMRLFKELMANHIVYRGKVYLSAERFDKWFKAFMKRLEGAL